MRFEQQIRSACSVNEAAVHPQICPHVEAISSRRGGCVFRASPRRDLAGINNVLRIKALIFFFTRSRSDLFTRTLILYVFGNLSRKLGRTQLGLEYWEE